MENQKELGIEKKKDKEERTNTLCLRFCLVFLGFCFVFLRDLRFLEEEEDEEEELELEELEEEEELEDLGRL